MDKNQKTKKRIKLSTPKTRSRPSNPHFICDKEVVIQLEKLSDSFVAEMTAGGSALPPEQTKKRIKLSTPKTRSRPSNAHIICDKEVVIQLERLSDSVVAEMTAGGSALPPEQVNESNDDALGINSLPDEIIEEVFGFLTQNQLGQIARVCKRWNVLTKSPLLWKKVNVQIFSSDRQKNTATKSFINGLPSCVTFIRLGFSECESLDFEELCVKLQQNCPRLGELILELKSITWAHFSISNILPEVINFCTQYLLCLKKLVFHNCNFPNHSRTVEITDNSEIEVLDLCNCYISPGMKQFPFSKLLYLKELRLSFINVDDTWFVDDSSFFNRLRVLDLGMTRVTASTFQAIKNHGHNLKELYLCSLNLQAHDLNFNKSVFPQLKTICLSCYHITCEGVASLIQSCPFLENVYVHRNVARSFAVHPFVLANRCKSGIVKAVHPMHVHSIDYLHTLKQI